MNETMHVVVWDPSGEYWEGGLVEAQTGRVLQTRGVATLPIEASLVRRSAVGGYFKRSWGSGWPLNAAVPRLVCPMLLHAVSGDGLQRLNWCARLVPVSDNAREVLEARIEEGGTLVGTLRLAPNSGQPGALSGGFGSTAGTAVRLDKIGKMDANGGWTVYGDASIATMVHGYFGCALYGSIAGIAVAWAAVSQSR